MPLPLFHFPASQMKIVNEDYPRFIAGNGNDPGEGEALIYSLYSDDGSPPEKGEPIPQIFVICTRKEDRQLLQLGAPVPPNSLQKFYEKIISRGLTCYESDDGGRRGRRGEKRKGAIASSGK